MTQKASTFVIQHEDDKGLFALFIDNQDGKNLRVVGLLGILGIIDKILTHDEARSYFRELISYGFKTSREDPNKLGKVYEEHLQRIKKSN